MIKTHEELLKLHGKRVACEFEGKKIDDAKICVEDDDVYVCQNEYDGTMAEDMMGYKYSWFTSSEWNSYEDDNAECKNIQVVEEIKDSVKELTESFDKLTPRVIRDSEKKSNKEWQDFIDAHNALRKKAMELPAGKLKSFISVLKKLG